MFSREMKTAIKRNLFLMRIIAGVYNYFPGRNKIRLRGKNNKILISPNVLLCNNRIVAEGNNNIIEIDNGSRITNTYIYMWGDNNRLRIGKDVIYRKGTLLLKDGKCVIEFGDGTTVEDAYMVASEGGKISMGKDCMIAHGVDVRNGDSHSIIDINTKKRINPAKDIKIGNHVWLGAYSQVIKGAVIGDNSVVGLCSVVNNHISSNSVCAGVPAKVIKENTTWVRERL